MKLSFLLFLGAASIAATGFTYADATTSGVIKLEVPVQTIITPIAADTLDFGSHPEGYFEEARTLKTHEDVFSNVSAATEGLCLTASFPKYNTTENLPYLSSSDSSPKVETPIFLSKVDYTTCGTSAKTFDLIGTGSGTHSVSLPADSGITESACMGTAGSPGYLTVTTLPVSTTDKPLLGGTYTSTLDLSVAPGEC